MQYPAGALRRRWPTQRGPAPERPLRRGRGGVEGMAGASADRSQV